MSDPHLFTPRQLLSIVNLEIAYLVTATLMAVAYGCVLTLSIQCFSILATTIKTFRPGRSSFLLWFVVAIFIIDTAFLGAVMKFVVLGYVLDSDFPGGPPAFFVENQSLPPNVIVNVCVVLSTCLSDALLVSDIAGS